MNIVLIRHAERDPSGDDKLSIPGKRRAAMLSRMFRESGVSAIFTSEFTRTKQTAQPLAEVLTMTPKVIASDVDAARAQLLASGSLPLVIGHSDTVPALLAALGASPDVEIQDNEFDRMFIVSVDSGSVSMLALRYINV